MKNRILDVITKIVYRNSGSHLLARVAAFTLAEVLITLAIIGIVAALTIPNIIQSYKKTVVETRLKRAYSLVNQAIRLSEIDNGPTESWDTLGASVTSTATYDDMLAWYNKYLNKYLKSVKIDKSERSESTETLVVYLADGSAITFANYIYDVWVYIYAKDVNNPDARTGRERFSFRFSPVLIGYQEGHENFKYVKNSGLEPYTAFWDGTLEGLYDSSNNYACTKDIYANLCTKWIQMNGWKIPENYPFKF